MAGEINQSKQIWVRRLRALGLIDVADNAAFVIDVWRNRAANRDFRLANPAFARPPLAHVYEVASAANWAMFAESGARHARLISAAILDYAPKRDLRVLDWGCGPARVVRHMGAALAPRAATLSGCDPNRGFIAWAQRALPDLSFARIGFDPPLPYPDASFDVVYAISILTHLSEERIIRWLIDVRRVLAEDGVAVITAHRAENARRALDQRELAAFNAGHVIERGGAREGGRAFATYLPAGAVKRLANRAGLNVIAHIEDGPALAMGQDIWVFQPRPG